MRCKVGRVVRSIGEIEEDIKLQSKVCTKCGCRKPFNEFRIRSSYKDKRSMVCKVCSTPETKGNVRSKVRIEEDIKLQSKVCCRCGERKPFSEFYLNKRVLDGRRHWCIPCNSEVYKSSDKKKSAARLRYLKAVYKGSESDIRALMDSQKGCCGICGISLVSPDSVQSYAVDHNHETDEIRGLLCHSCNRMLGQARDSISILEGGINYLIKNGNYENTWVRH